MIQKDIRDDIKITLQFSRDPQETTFKVSLFSFKEDKDSKRKVSVWDKATWDGEIATNVQFQPDNKVLVTFNYADAVLLEKWDKGWFLVGRLHGTIYMGYADSEMPDGTYDEMICLDIPIEIINKDYCNG